MVLGPTVNKLQLLLTLNSYKRAHLGHTRRHHLPEVKHSSVKMDLVELYSAVQRAGSFVQVGSLCSRLQQGAAACAAPGAAYRQPMLARCH